MKILGLETSCDETGVAIYDSEHGLLSDVVFSQVKMHAKYGGVVPELASRDHIRKIGLLVNQATEEARIRLQDLDGVAYTAGPGLAGALLVGAGFSKSLAWGLDVPALGIHHMEGHLLAPMIDEVVPIDMPFLALLVSGGHTLLVDAFSLGSYEVLGESLDDAVGEAFDKVAKMLDLGYPGGPLVEQLAKSGDPDRFDFPRPMVNRPGLDFSFSGLKTHVRNTIAQHPIDAALKADVCRGFTDAVVDVLVVKCRRAIRQSGAKKLVVAGGVSANKDIRNGLEMLGKEEDVRVVFPSMKFTTDNGAMIAYVGYRRMGLGERDKTELAVRARWPLNELSSP